MLTNEELYHKLIDDLYRIGLPVDEVKLSIRPYSKSYYGRYLIPYNNKAAKVFIYPYATPDMKLMYPYSVVLYFSIHEMIHHIQHTNPNFKRLRGVMHNPEFYVLFNMYFHKAVCLGLIKNGVVESYV